MVTMDDSNQAAPQFTVETKMLLLGLGIGVLADFLLWDGGLFGAGFLIWLSLFAVASYWMKYLVDGAWSMPVASWSIVAIFAASLIMLRTTHLLILLLWLTIIVAATMVILQLNSNRLRESTVVDYLYSQFWVFSSALIGIIAVLRNVDLRFGFSTPRLWAIFKGVVIVSPLLVLFISLFSSADAVFAAHIQKIVKVFSLDLSRHIFMISFFSWMATGLLAAACINSTPWKFGREIKIRLGAEETAIIMGALAVLFITFVLFQLSYLFGGREFIESTSGLTVAEHARRGFFELATVATLTLGLLIAFASFCAGQRLFRPLASILVGCVMLILLSATQRMLLYVDSFGLTIDRLTVLAFMTWLGFSLVMFSGTVLRARVKDFLLSLTVVGIAMIFVFALLNPAALVARVNIERSITEGQEVDAQYLLRLGSDAVPTIMEYFDEMRIPSSDQCYVAAHFLGKLSEAESRSLKPQSWRSWSASRAAAVDALMARHAELQAIAQHCRSEFR